MALPNPRGRAFEQAAPWAQSRRARCEFALASRCFPVALVRSVHEGFRLESSAGAGVRRRSLAGRRFLRSLS